MTDADIGETHRRAARTMVAMTLFGYTLNFMDRQILSVLIEPIKVELQVSDTRMGLLTGLAFASFYAVVGVPIAALSDRYPRKRIIAVCMAAWSLLTMAFGLARNFPQMLLARMGVGIGEAGFAPAAFSMIADYYPADRRAAATAVGAIGAMIGTTLGLMGGGYVADHAGWRVAMMMAGVPGLLFALLFLIVVREPPRGLSGGAAEERGGDSAGVAALLANPAYLCALAAGMAASFVIFACMQWLPSYLIRSYHFTKGGAGLVLGPLLGGVGALSLLTSGWLTDRGNRRDPRWSAWLPALGCLAACPLLAAAFLVQGAALSLGLFALAYFAGMSFTAPLTALIQGLVPLGLRARATALYLLLTTLIGFGLGPVAAGALSSFYQPAFGADSLRYGLATLAPVMLLAPILLLIVARHLRPLAGAPTIPAVVGDIANA